MNKIVPLIVSILFLLNAAAGAQAVDMQWIGNTPEIAAGVSWGLPFTKGKIKDNQAFSLTNSKNENIPLQSWVMARHSDGSVKWVGFAASVTPGNASGLKVNLLPGAVSAIQGITAQEDNTSITVSNRLGEYVFNKSGQHILKHIKLGNTVVAENGQLLCMLEDRTGASQNTIRYHDFVSEIKKVTLEQKGPVKATVKIEGVHKDLKGAREWLPFTVRFYIYDNIEQVKMVHTIIFDGDQHNDFIKGLGVSFDVPLREDLHNRHVKFSGEGKGLWNEPVQPMTGRRMISFPDEQNLYARQVLGERMPDKKNFNQQGQFLLNNWASWDDYTMSQLSSDGFTIKKRTGDQSSWVGTAGGTRSTGYALAGDVSGGLAVSLKNFWQSFPSEIEINNMRSGKGTLKVWMWSPRGDAMDLRHYDTVGHDLDAAYEDYQEGMSTPYGVGRTSELTLYPFAQMPTPQQAVGIALASTGQTQLMASPAYLQGKAFGYWSLENQYTNGTGQWLEKQINDYIDFYATAQEQHKWYGFWNYGDFMHSYNTGRHMWNYDVGGNAWANTELSPDLWLWYAFIRSGREDIFRLATAMTRHTSEVDMYHIGDMAGLGSRHNVSHWGCGAKEARIGQAWWKRFYYYLTTDERMGDIMSEVVDADYKMLKYDPLRIAQPRDKFPTSAPTRLRWGPDWIAFAGNWFTEWERTGNRKWLDKINAGMNSLAALPQGLFTGQGPLGYDPATGKITYEGDPSLITHSNHLANLMGGVEVMMELWDGVGNKKFNEIYALYAKFYALPQDDPIRQLRENKKYKDWWGHWNIPRITAFASVKLNDPYLAKVAWKRMFGSEVRDGKVADKVRTTGIDMPFALYPIDEGRGISTNSTAQWDLDAIIMMGLVGDSMPSLNEIIENNPPRQSESGSRGQQQAQ